MRGKYKNGRIITDKSQYKKDKPAKTPVAGDDTAAILRKTASEEYIKNIKKYFCMHDDKYLKENPNH